MNTTIAELRLTRVGILVILAALVALLGANAKRSQFDGPPHHGYLSKAVKMEGARLVPDDGTPTNSPVAAPIESVTLAPCDPETHDTHPVTGCTPVSISSPPLRA